LIRVSYLLNLFRKYGYPQSICNLFLELLFSPLCLPNPAAMPLSSVAVLQDCSPHACWLSSSIALQYSIAIAFPWLLNPDGEYLNIYGQGMTVSAISSLLLRDWLTRPSSQQQFPNGASFQKQLARSNAFPWSLATGLDSRFPTTQGTISPNWVSKLFRGYTERLAAHAHKDADLHLWFMEMAHMMKPPRIVD
jgi:hypothetical protein